MDYGVITLVLMSETDDVVLETESKTVFQIWRFEIDVAKLFLEIQYFGSCVQC